MKFTANTKPISEGLDLAIISSNITKFYQKSCIVELTIEEDHLRINTEASSIKSELRFVGRVEGEGQNHTFVDSTLFKNLIKTLDSDVIEFEIKDDGLTITSGKSKYNLPQVVSVDDIELNRPQTTFDIQPTASIDKEAWSFVKDHQLYAISMSFVTPVYTYIWLGENGDVLVGDYDNSIFTHSKEAKLGTRCLIPDTIVNLLTTVPENTKIIQLGRNYELSVETDPYIYICEFCPSYEDDENIGNYSSDIILSLFNTDQTPAKLEVAKVYKYISQAELFSTATDDTINMSVIDGVFSLKNINVDCNIKVNPDASNFEDEFKISMLKDVISHIDDDEFTVSPVINDGETSAIIVKTDNMEVILTGIDKK